MKRILLVIVVLVFAPHSRAENPPSGVAGLFLSPENLAIVAQPERVEACILRRGQLWFTRDERKRKYKDGPITTVPFTVGATPSAMITADTTYIWNEAKACMPIWNARLKFYRGGHCISADFCFGCDIVALFRDGKALGGANFDHGSDAIFEAIRSLFPEDEVVLKIAAVKKQREEDRAVIKRLIEEEKERKANQSTTAQRASRVADLTRPAK